MNLDKLKSIASMFTGEKSVTKSNILGETTVDLNKIADILTEKIKDVIAEFKEHRKQLSWKFWTAEQKAIYQPIIKEVMEVIEVVGKYVKLTNEQKEELVVNMVWKIVEPMLPKWIAVVGGSFIKSMISSLIKTIMSAIKKKELPSEAFNAENFAMGSVR